MQERSVQVQYCTYLWYTYRYAGNYRGNFPLIPSPLSQTSPPLPRRAQKPLPPQDGQPL